MIYVRARDGVRSWWTGRDSNTLTASVESVECLATARPARINDITGELTRFTEFLSLQKTLSRRTVKDHINRIRHFLNAYDGTVSPRTLKAHLQFVKNKWSIKTYANHLGSLKVYVRDFLGKAWLDGYDFPNIAYEPLVIPSKNDIREFYDALPDSDKDYRGKYVKGRRYHALYLLLASSGLRIGEALSLTRRNIAEDKRIVIPKAHETSSTKNSWVTFYNVECERNLSLDGMPTLRKVFPADINVYRAFQKAQHITDLHITPQRLREFFCEQMGNLGVNDRYIDAFCGRVPSSILARRYTDYSPTKLQAVYERADLKVLA